MSLVISQTLTNYARGLNQDLNGGSISSFLCPDVVTGGSVGKFKKFDDYNAFQDYATERAPGSDPTRIVVSASDADFNCKPHALEATVDESERDEWGDGDPLGVQQIKVRALVTNARLAKERRIIAKARSLAAVSGKGTNWSTGSGNPCNEIDEQIEALATEAGMMPNRLALGLPAWRIIRSHPEVIKRFPGADKIGVTLDQFASLLLNPAIEIKVGILSGNTKKIGDTAGRTKANLFGAEVFTFLSQDNASKDDPSFMKCFMTRSGNIDSVGTYNAPNGLWQGIITKWTEDVQLTGSACGRRITVS